MSRIPESADPFEEEGLPTGGDLTLDGKRITGDAQEGIPAPGDRLAAEEYGTTALEEREGEPLDARLARVQPEADVVEELPATAELPYPEDPDERQGRLVSPDEGARPDEEAAEVAGDVGTDAGGFSAEERAIRIEPD
jgi:hypothetical protein